MTENKNPIGVLLSKPVRQKQQAITLWVVGVIGFLGIFFQLDNKNYPMAVLFAVLSVAAIVLGVWIWRQSKKPAE